MAKKIDKEHEKPIIKTTNGLSSRGIIYVDVIIVVLVLAGAAFGGWYVWQKNGDKSKDSRTSQSGNETKDPTDETADWIPVTTQGGAFSMKVPDGWKLTNYPDNFLGSAEVTYSPGVSAVVDHSDKEYIGYPFVFVLA